MFQFCSCQLQDDTSEIDNSNVNLFCFFVLTATEYRNSEQYGSQINIIDVNSAETITYDTSICFLREIQSRLKEARLCLTYSPERSVTRSFSYELSIN